ncbi:Rv3235 family protein [Streptomyces sp. NPDC002499]
MTRAQHRTAGRPPARRDPSRPGGTPPRTPGGTAPLTAPDGDRPPGSRAGTLSPRTRPTDGRPASGPGRSTTSAPGTVRRPQGTATPTQGAIAPGPATPSRDITRVPAPRTANSPTTGTATGPTARTATGLTTHTAPGTAPSARTPAHAPPGTVPAPVTAGGVTGPASRTTVPAQARRRPPAPQPRPTDVFADRLLAVLSGQRPVHWMLRHTAGRAYDELALLADRTPLRTRGARPVVRDIGYFVPREGAIEAFARIGAGDQLRAMAFRLEQGVDLRWRCTAVEMGGPRPTHLTDDD